VPAGHCWQLGQPQAPGGTGATTVPGEAASPHVSVGQAHVVWAALACFPQGQAVHCDEPAAETLSPTHGVAAVAPGKAVTEPAGAGAHAERPAVLVSVPAGHSCGAVAPAVDTNEPAGAGKQAPAAVDPVSGLYVPVAHGLQAVLSATSLYVPAAAAVAVVVETTRRTR
jgi:hypothetical protein